MSIFGTIANTIFFASEQDFPVVEVGLEFIVVPITGSISERKKNTAPPEPSRSR